MKIAIKICDNIIFLFGIGAIYKFISGKETDGKILLIAATIFIMISVILETQSWLGEIKENRNRLEKSQKGNSEVTEDVPPDRHNANQPEVENESN